MLAEKAFLAAADPVLARILEAVPPPKAVGSGDVFHDLMSCLLEQQIHHRSTKKTFQKMLDAAGLAHLTVENWPIFEEKALASAKLNLQKLEAVEAALAFFDREKVDWPALSDAAAMEKLCSIRGVGEQTAQLILLYTLGRADIFPADDFHLKTIMPRLWGLDPTSRLRAQMLEVAEAWRPHRSLAVRWIFEWKKAGQKGATAF